MAEMSYSSEQKFCVNGEGRDALKLTLSLALKLCGMSVESIYIHPDYGIFFGWLDETEDGWQKLSDSLSLDEVTQMAWSFLRSPKVKMTYNKLFQADHFAMNFDGIIKKGWEVFYPDIRGDYGNDELDLFYAIIAVKPTLLYLGK